MRIPFRDHHILAIMEAYTTQALPLDYFLSNYFRSNKAIGSKDRGVIAETVYALVRWRGLLDHICSEDPSWESKLLAFKKDDFESYKKRNDIPIHVRLSFPKNLFDRLVESLGMDRACEFCLNSNIAAPTTVRVNAIKTTREELLALWKDKYDVIPCMQAPYGITFNKRINFYELQEFKQGLFDIQDEGSQLLASLIEAKPGELVMDYCAGAGGKALAFAPNMQNKGQIYLHDIRKHALLDCRKRFKRAGIQNAQIIHDDEAKLKKLKKKMDWVLVDAPCSGTGTLRRNPDMKWKYDDAMLIRLVGQQRMIFEKALSFLKPGGRIVYATCSVLTEENREQVAHFAKTYGLEVEGELFESLPQPGGMDGFFGAVLKKMNIHPLT